MSFSKEVKKEIANLEVNNHSLKGELYGYLKLKTEIIISNQTLEAEIKSDNLAIIRRLVMIIKKIYHFDSQIRSKKRTALDKRNIYYLSLQEQSLRILQDLDIIASDYNFIEKIPHHYHINDIIRGMFLARGTINSPKTSTYHLEIACNTNEESDFLIKHLANFNINAKSIKRKDDNVVYIKKAEQIGDFLKIIGAVTTLFTFENERIRRDLNNVVNRIINCDLANSDKTQALASKQLKQIEFVEKRVGFENLPLRLMEAVTLRTKNPESSLQELSDLSEDCIGRYISKSGINHCFRDLEILYLSLVNENQQTK